MYEPFEDFTDHEGLQNWLDDIQASADADIAGQQFEHDFALEAGKLSAGHYDEELYEAKYEVAGGAY